MRTNDRSRTEVDKVGGLCATWVVGHTCKNRRLSPDGLLKLLRKSKRTVSSNLAQRQVFGAGLLVGLRHL